MANGNLNGCKQIAIPDVPPKLEQLKEMLTNPERIDDATIELGIPPILCNLHLATNADLFYLNIGIREGNLYSTTNYG